MAVVRRPVVVVAAAVVVVIRSSVHPGVSVQALSIH